MNIKRIFFVLVILNICIFHGYGKLPNKFESTCLKTMYLIEHALNRELERNYPELGVVEDHQSYLSNMYANGENLRDCWIKKKWNLSPMNRFPAAGKIELVIFFFDEELKKDHWVRKLSSPNRIIEVRKFPEIISLNLAIISTNRVLTDDVIKWLEKIKL